MNDPAKITWPILLLALIITLLPFKPYAGKTLFNTATELGIAAEAQQNFADGYVFATRLFDNHVYYEVRANLILTHLDRNGVRAPLVPQIKPIFQGQHFLGPGGVGIVGYMLPISRTLGVMPFVRVQALTNTVAAYSDRTGNEVRAVSYTEFIGLKWLMAINSSFSFYAQYFWGPQQNILSGKGLFSTPTPLKNKAIISAIELDFPYQITPSWKIMPYLQFNMFKNHPRLVIGEGAFNMANISGSSMIYAIKMGYRF